VSFGKRRMKCTSTQLARSHRGDVRRGRHPTHRLRDEFLRLTWLRPSAQATPGNRIGQGCRPQRQRSRSKRPMRE
jgi:hypothetical protein